MAKLLGFLSIPGPASGLLQSADTGPEPFESWSPCSWFAKRHIAVGIGFEKRLFVTREPKGETNQLTRIDHQPALVFGHTDRCQ